MNNDAYIKHNRPEDGGKLGVYRHPDSGETLPADSFAQADAYLRLHWEYVGPLPSRLEVAERDQKALKQQIADAKNSEGNVVLDTLNSEVAAAKAEEKENGEPVRPSLSASDKTSELSNVEAIAEPKAEVTKNTPKELKEDK